MTGDLIRLAIKLIIFCVQRNKRANACDDNKCDFVLAFPTRKNQTDCLVTDPRNAANIT